MRANTRWLIEHTKGKDFIYTPVGSTGEFYAMADDECKAVIKTVVAEVKGKNIVFGGAGRAGTAETIKMAQYAESVGADGVQIIIPYYHIPTEEGMYQHFKQIAESVNIGVMLYNNPAVSGSWVKPHLMARISEIPNIVALKENTPLMGAFYEMAKAIGSLPIFHGGDVRNYAFTSLYRTSGFVSGFANFAPDLVYSIYEAGSARDFNKMTQLVKFWDPLYDFMNKVNVKHGPDTGVIPSAAMTLSVYKVAMDIVGIKGGEVRMPMYSIDKGEKDELRSIMKAMNLVK
jgi:4-hydroxy-tetrahydrodipicolinate synthase